jgi:hypothetical protein
MRELEEPQYFLEGEVTVAGGIVGLKPTCGVPEGAKAAQPTLVSNSGLSQFVRQLMPIGGFGRWSRC